MTQMHSLPVTENGFFRMTVDEYHADPAPYPSLSASLAKLLVNATPRHAYVNHPRLCRDFQADDDKRFDLGTAAHAIMLGHGRDIEVIYAADYRGKDAQTQRKDALADGRTPLLVDQHTRAKAICGAIREQLDGAGLAKVFAPGRGAPECVIAWDDPYAGWCRSQIDWLSDDMMTIDDLKITGRPASNDAALAYHIADMGYEIQAAFYERGLSILRPDLAGRIRFRFHFCEDSPPHALRSVELDAAALAIGRKKVSVAMGIWQRCIESGEWPLHPPGVARIEYPVNHEKRWMEREEFDPAIRRLLSADPYLGPLVETTVRALAGPC